MYAAAWMKRNRQQIMIRSSYNLLKKISYFAEHHPDRAILHDSVHESVMSFRQLDEMSGRVYEYLHAKGLGKEDFVLICLPRSYDAIAALTGVLKNGSCFVIVEEGYAHERIEYIKEDCSCKAVIDTAAWKEIEKCEARKGFVQADEHDAAFAVYTSGSTGKPKGILHETGNIGLIIESHYFHSCEPFSMAGDRFALITPLHFIAALDFIFYNLYFGVEIFMVPGDTVRKPELLYKYMTDNAITSMFITSSYLRKFPKLPEQFRAIIIGAEPVTDALREGVEINNSYSLSETGFSVAHYLIEKELKHTPVGKSDCGITVKLLDDDGKEVADGQIGEVCFDNPFVRGYINLPDKNAKMFRNGIFHTEDLGRKDADGNLTICGRLSEMVKINGNRVEPAEIEHIFKVVSGADWNIAKGFETEDKNFVCLYYSNDTKLDIASIVDQMREYLPKYMIPAYIIRLDEIPMNINGKVRRAALVPPSSGTYAPEDVYSTLK